MITIFACPKPFCGHFDVIQRNAIRSWTLLQPKPEIILVGDDEGVPEVCKEFGLVHVAEIEKNEYGTPMVNSIFQVCQERAKHSVVCYVNSDIILMSDFMRVVNTVAARMPRFLILGQRWDVDITTAQSFDSVDWETDLKGLLARKGTLHAPSGIDFFCFPRGMYANIPPFAIGRLKWDNWLVWRARSHGIPIVDVTEAVPVVHQNHGYAVDKIRLLDATAISSGDHGYASGNLLRFDGHWVELGAEAQRNLALVSDEENLNIWAATCMVDRKGRLLRRRLTLTPSYLYYQLKCVVPLYWPAFGTMFLWMRTVVKALLRNIRRQIGKPQVA